MKSRTELFSIFQKFFAEIHNQFHTFIHILRSDNALEYLSTPFSDFLSSHGILHQSSCAYTPQQNGVVEHKNRHLVETARTLLLHHTVPQCFWGDVILTACYLINRMSSSVMGDQVPHSLLFPNQPLLSPFACFRMHSICPTYLLLVKINFLLRPRSASSLVIPAFNAVTVAILLIHINTSFLLMSSFFNILLSSLPPRLPIPRFYLYLSSFPFRPYHLSPQLLHLVCYRFILVIRVPTPGLLMTHLLWRPPP